MNLLEAARGFIPARRTVRIGVTGLARSGKTSLLTSLAINLLALGQGVAALPALTECLAGRRIRVRSAPAGATDLPRFDAIEKSRSLAADPPTWPRPTDATSLLALDIDIDHPGLAGNLPPQRLRLELLDYPGEWLLDMPLLTRDFAAWSTETLTRLEPVPSARPFLDFVRALPRTAPADEALIHSGHALYRALLRTLQEEGRWLLQPGRFLMPAPGAEPPWMAFFPRTGPTGAASGLTALLATRYERYRDTVRNTLHNPGFRGIDRLVILADLLGALHAGRYAFDDAVAALRLVAGAIARDQPLPLLPAWLQPWGIARIAFAATKADHVARAQRANLAALMRGITNFDGDGRRTFAIAAISCTEDFTWTLDSRPVSAVRGHVSGQGVVRSYPGEVPDRPPGADDWAHPFLSLPSFSPKRLDPMGSGAIPQVDLDRLLLFLLEDML